MSILIILFASCGTRLLLNCNNDACHFDSASYSCINLESSKLSVPSVDNSQVIEIIKNKIYIFGADSAGMGIVIELDDNLQPTDWVGYLSYNGNNLISHPAGVAYREGYPTFIGGLTGQLSYLYQIDWDLFIADGNLDRALIKTISDEASNRGTRPEYIPWEDSWAIATTDYDSADKAFFRILNVDQLILSQSTLEPDVMLLEMPSDSFIQDLYWWNEKNSLVLVQNFGPESGWRISFVDINNLNHVSSLEDAVSKSMCIDQQSELESFSVLPDDGLLFLSASLPNNLSVVASSNQKLF